MGMLMVYLGVVALLGVPLLLAALTLLLTRRHILIPLLAWLLALLLPGARRGCRPAGPNQGG